MASTYPTIRTVMVYIARGRWRTVCVPAGWLRVPSGPVLPGDRIWIESRWRRGDDPWAQQEDPMPFWDASEFPCVIRREG